MALGLFSLTILVATSMMAASWETKDWTQWSSQDCFHILKYSPWAVQGAMVTDTDFKSPGHTVDTTFSPLAQIISSLVIRQAIVRQAQFDQHYDKMKPQEKQQFDQMAATCLGLKLDDRIIVRADGPRTTLFMTPYIVVSGRKILAIQSPQRNAVSPCTFPFVNVSNTNHDLVFPRVADGEPVIQAGDKKMIVYAPWGNQFQFDLGKMTYKGKLDY
jgi:hypothetical protein